MAGHQQEVDEVLDLAYSCKKGWDALDTSCDKVCSIQRGPLWSVVVRVPKLVKLLLEASAGGLLVSSKQSCVICRLHCLLACEKPWGCRVRKGLAPFTMVTGRI